jgi:hypothetical protein
MAAIIILSNWEMSLAGFTRVGVTKPESGPNSIEAVNAIGGMREEITMTTQM